MFLDMFVLVAVGDGLDCEILPCEFGGKGEFSEDVVLRGTVQLHQCLLLSMSTQNTTRKRNSYTPIILSTSF